jgi:hypothetical protein
VRQLAFRCRLGRLHDGEFNESADRRFSAADSRLRSAAPSLNPKRGFALAHHAAAKCIRNLKESAMNASPDPLYLIHRHQAARLGVPPFAPDEFLTSTQFVSIALLPAPHPPPP